MGQNSSADNPSGNEIDLLVASTNGGAIDFTNEPKLYNNNNLITVSGYVANATSVINGTPNVGDRVNISVNQGGSGKSVFIQNPFPVNAVNIGGPVYGTAALTSSCAGSATDCYFSASNASTAPTDPTNLHITANGTGGIVQAANGNGYLSGTINGQSNYVFLPSYDQFFVPIKVYGYSSIASLPACNAGNASNIAYIYDTTALVAPTWHGTVQNGGSYSVRGLISCNGNNWQYE